MPRQALDKRPGMGLDTAQPLSVQGAMELYHQGQSQELDLRAASQTRTPERDAHDAELEHMRALERRVFSARRLTEPRPEAELLTTGVATVDRLLGGGIGRGELIEVVGRRSSGRFALVLSALAATTRGGEAVALVDLGDQLDPQVAAEVGVELERLLWLRPQRCKQALGAAELLLAAGFPLVVLDLGLPPVPGGRGVEGSWLRLARTALAHEGALFVATPYRACGAAAHAVVEMASNRPHWSGRQPAPLLLTELRATAALTRGKGRLVSAARRQERATVRWWWCSGSVAVPTSAPTLLASDGSPPATLPKPQVMGPQVMGPQVPSSQIAVALRPKRPAAIVTAAPQVDPEKVRRAG